MKPNLFYTADGLTLDLTKLHGITPIEEIPTKTGVKAEFRLLFPGRDIKISYEASSRVSARESAEKEQAQIILDWCQRSEPGY